MKKFTTVICEDTKEVCYTYKEYLNSEHWKKLKYRYKTWKLSPRVCQICEEPNKIVHVHHKTYKRVGKEKLTDLSLLCGDCYEELHIRFNNAVESGEDLSSVNRWSLVKKMKKQLIIEERKEKKVHHKKSGKIEKSKSKKESILEQTKNQLKSERKQRIEKYLLSKKEKDHTLERVNKNVVKRKNVKR